MDFYDAWNVSVEDIKKQVTGVGVWTALNVAIPIALEDDTFILGVPERESELKGHLQLSNTTRVMTQELTKRLGRPIKVEVIDGITINHWESVKRRRVENARLTKEAAERDMVAKARSSHWDVIYEQMAREFGALTNKALPQIRAQFLLRCVDLCVSEIKAGRMSEDDHRNFARCLDRIASYTELPAAYAATLILKETGSIE